jgi:hypothetical protein
MAGWNDITGATYTDSTQLAASLTGVGLSGDGGSSFSDLVGLPNGNPDEQWFGDPTVASLGDGRHFVVGSLYMPSLTSCNDGLPAEGTVAVSVATVNTAGRLLASPSAGCELPPPQAGSPAAIALTCERTLSS